MQSERVNLFDPKNLAIGATILVLGIGGNLALKQSATGVPDGLFPFKIPVLFPEGIPAIVFAAIVGILMNVLFVVLPPSKFGVTERSNLESLDALVSWKLETGKAGDSFLYGFQPDEVSQAIDIPSVRQVLS